MRRPRRAALAALLLPLAGAAPARMHPLHTTLTEVTVDAGHVTLRVRVFADDFARGVAAHRARPGEDAALAYLGASVGLWDHAGHHVQLTSCGVRATGVLLWHCVTAPAPRGISGMRVRNTLQFAVYDDQVNVVQARYAGRATSLLFVPGDAPKRLP